MAIATAQENDNRDLVKRVGSWPERARTYIDELKQEMRRVTWPSRKQVIATTTVVIASVFLFAAYFFLVDLVVGRLINRVFEATTK
jgi:preprotein translocase subunit SecE